MKMELSLMPNEVARGLAEDEVVDLDIFPSLDEDGGSAYISVAIQTLDEEGEDLYTVNLREVLEDMVETLDWDHAHFKEIPGFAAMLREYADKVEEKVKAVMEFECGFCERPTHCCWCAEEHPKWRAQGFIYARNDEERAVIDAEIDRMLRHRPGE